MHHENAVHIFKYAAYGLIIASNIAIPELMPAGMTDMPADVCILKRKVPEEISDPVVKNDFFQASGSELILNIKGICKYHISNGTHIAMEPEEHADEQTVRIFLLGTSFGALLLQRGILPVHGSAVVVGGCCIVFTGFPGSGKSTLSLALRKLGYPFLADDISALTFDGHGCIWVQPGYPQQKVRRDIAEFFGEEGNPAVLRNMHTGKYFLPAGDGFMNAPARLYALCEIKAADCDKLSIKRLDGIGKLDLIINHTYRVQLLDYFGMKARHFSQCADIAGKIRAFRMTRPEGVNTIGEQIDLICSEITI